MQADTTPKADKTPWRPTRQKEVSVHKTDVCHKASLATDKPEIKTDNSERLCPIHKKPHLLQKCRAFREKPLEERKAFLKENRICYKCCISTQHIAKYCETKTTCLECGSENHVSALHPGPAPWTKEPCPSVEQGREQDSPPASDVTTRCTKVCGENQSDGSCSKICLVMVYPAGHQDRALKIYSGA